MELENELMDLEEVPVELMRIRGKQGRTVIRVVYAISRKEMLQLTA